MILIQSVNKQFKEKVVLNNLNLMIPDGSIFGLIGPNGAGKSTLLKILVGTMRSDSGKVEIDGQNVWDNPVAKQNILLLSDDPFFSMNDTLKTLKTFYSFWYPNMNMAVYEKYVDVFQLDENKPLKNFSKGMKRQAFIIFALAIAPKVLLLDEAFDGLDPMMRLVFKRALNELIMDYGTTVVISSHNLRELEDICDTFGIVEDCTIVTSGKIDEAKENVHKIQLAFKEEVNADMFAHLDVLKCDIQSRVVNLVVKGDIDEVKDKLAILHPLMMEILPVNLEELFIFEMEKKGYGELYEIV